MGASFALGLSTSRTCPDVALSGEDTVAAEENHEGQEAVVRQLAAVRVVLDEERQIGELDILVSTLLELLRDGPATIGELAKRAAQVWPGARIDFLRVQAALTAGMEAGYFAPLPPSGDGRWTSTNTEGTTTSYDWARSTLARTREALIVRAKEQILWDVSPAEANVLLNTIVEALSAAIRASYSAYYGDVVELSEFALVPATYDRTALEERLDRVRLPKVRKDFLRGATYTALDPMSEFGTELVSHIATGYVLHAFLARQDQITEQALVKSLKDEVLVLDTPNLVALLGIDRRAEVLFEALARSVREGVAVQLPSHVLKEFFEVLDRVEGEYVGEIEEGLKAGADSAVLYQLSGDEVVLAWMTYWVDGRPVPWTRFRARAYDLSQRLEAIGVTRTDSGSSENDPGRLRYDRCRSALVGALASRRPRAGRAQPRGSRQIDTDALTMAQTWKIRERKGRDATSSVWPGSWVLTTDTAMGAAYSTVSGKDRFPLTVTPSQWLTLLTAFGGLRSVHELARPLATLQAQETMLAIAGRYSPKDAMRFAQAFKKARGDKEFDVRLAQFSMQEVLERQPNVVDEPLEAQRDIVNALLRDREQRREDLAELEVRRLNQERNRLEREAADKNAAHESEISRLHGRLEGIEQREREATRELSEKVRELNEERRLRQVENLFAERRLKVVVVLLLGSAIVIAAYVTGHKLFALWTATSVAVFFVQSRAWVSREDADWRNLLTALIPQAMNAVQFIQAVRGK